MEHKNNKDVGSQKAFTLSLVVA